MESLCSGYERNNTLGVVFVQFIGRSFRLKREVVLGREKSIGLKAVGLLRWIGRGRMQCRDRMHVFRRCAQSPLPNALVGVKFWLWSKKPVDFVGKGANGSYLEPVGTSEW
jgi:hypothetical protein